MENDGNFMPPQETPTLVIDQFPFSNLGMPVLDIPYGPSVYASRQAISINVPWAPFNLELEWDIALWVKMHGQSSTAVSELLGMQGVCVSLIDWHVFNQRVKGHRYPWPLIPYGQWT